MFIRGVGITATLLLPLTIEDLNRDESKLIGKFDHSFVLKLKDITRQSSEGLGKAFSPETKFMLWDILAKNTWISLLGIMWISSFNKDPGSIHLRDKVGLWVCLCSSSWLIRFGAQQVLKKCNTKFAQFIAPSDSFHPRGER